jgi:FMN-dependent oxidoreductase (nitrilotriacetate monooxygenase family)
VPHTDQPSLILNAFLMSTGHHEASWRLPESDPASDTSVAYFQQLARTAERGRMDSVFFADSPSLMSSPARRPPQRFEPTLLLTAMAMATERIGLIATATTTYDEPYNTARRFASLDGISGGRAGWNVVTTASADASANFGLDRQPAHEERYERAREYLEVVLGLWAGWEEDAYLGDKAAGVHTDPAKVHELHHVGRHFRVRGPLNVGRSPQGWPVVVQAGSSDSGVDLAGRHAEAVFTAQRRIEDGRVFRDRIRASAVAHGRDPDTVKVLPGIVPIIGSTVEEARRVERELEDLLVTDHAARQLARVIGIPVAELDLDAPLPDDLPDPAQIEGSRARYELIVDLGRSEHLTVRQVIARLGGGRGHRTIVGTAEQVADDICTWVDAGAADGFNVMPQVLPSGLEAFVDQVVPILQERGRFRRDYAGRTLRDHYGLPVPRSAAAGAGSSRDVGEPAPPSTYTPRGA